jgi:hypothetical protein
MTNKYIITNCPSCRDFDVFGLPNKGCCYNFNDYCSRHNECVLKQIVELCKGELNSLETYIDVRSLECVILQNILKLLDIQEVE